MFVCGLQPTVGKYDITELHENTYYDVCVKVFTTQLSVDDDYDRPATGTVDLWNNYDSSQMAIDDGQIYGQARCSRHH